MDFFCDEIVLSVRQFRSEIKDGLYKFPNKIEEKWNLEEKLSYLEFLRKGYPDVGIIIDVKEKKKRIILDGIERCKVLEEFSGEILEGTEQKRIRIFELRGTNKEKLTFLRCYNFNGRRKSESELRKLIYGEYKEYDKLEELAKIFNIFYEEITVDFLLKILSRVTIKDLLEEDEMIEEYLSKYMKSLIESDYVEYVENEYLNDLIIQKKYSSNSIIYYEAMNELPTEGNIDTLVNFFLDKIIEYTNKEINYQRLIHNTLTGNALSRINEKFKGLKISSKTTERKIDELKQILKKIKKEEINIGLSIKSLEKDFYKYYKRK